MNMYLILFSCLLIFQECFAPPVTQNKENEAESPEKGLEEYMEYHRYLKEVVDALESDADFRKKLEKAEEMDIKSGKIAEELEFVSHHVRTKLDEIKRVELVRLKELTDQKNKLLNTNEIDSEDPTHHHLDHSNPHTFEIEDLKKLIKKTTYDLAEADKKRRDEFKEYELHKEYEKQNKLNHTTGEEHEKLEKQFKEQEDQHKKHEKLHEPGHRAQLEQVWEEQDQMQQDFDPKTFFMLHDLDGNGLWDQDEVKALFVKELEKMYEQGHPEDDMREKVEEMERMRESVFKEIDRNRDMFIDYEEFLAQTKTADFQQDHGWQGIDEQRPYTDEELQEYIRQNQMNQMPPAHQGYPNPNFHPNAPAGHPDPNFHGAQGVYDSRPAGYGNPGGYAPPVGAAGNHPNAVPQAAQFHAAQMPPQQLPPQGQQQGYQQQYQPPPPQQYQQYPPQQQYQQPPPQQQYQQPPQQQYQQPPPPQNQQVNQGNPQVNAQQPIQNQPPQQNQPAQAQQVNQQQQQGNVQQQQPPVVQHQQPNVQQQNIPNNQGPPPQVNKL